MTTAKASYDDFEQLVIQLHRDGEPGERFTVSGGPIDECDRAIEVFTALGHGATAWARLERHPTFLLVKINKAEHSPDATSLFQPNHPSQAGNKLKMLKRYFNQHPALAKQADTFRDLRRDIKNALKDRNGYMH